MPIIHVHLIRGRTPETRERLIEKLTHAACESLGCEAETVRVILNEMEPQNFGKAGKSFAAAGR